MKKNAINKLIPILFVTCLWISGCAQQPPVVVTEDTAVLTETAKNIVAQSIYINTLLNICAQLGDEAEYEAIAVQHDWLDKNWAAVIAADSYYSEQLKNETINYNNKQLALAAILLSHSTQNRAVNELGLKQRSTGNQQKTCVRRIKMIASGEMELTREPQTLIDLQSLQNNYIGDTRQIIAVPTLAGNISVNQAPGRSYFVLLEEFRRECPDAKFITLHNQWPQEAYGTYCGDLPVSLIDCEWGNCKRP